MPATTSSAKERLVRTAARLFYERGVTATGVDAVVAESGVSKPTLYAHFASKEQLVAAALELRHADRRAEVPAWIASHARTPRQRLLAVFDWLSQLYADGSGRGCAFLNAAAEAPDAASPVRVVTRAHKAWWRELLRELAKEAGLRRPDALAVQLQLLCDGVHARSVVDGDAESLREATRQARLAARILVDAATMSGARR